MDESFCIAITTYKKNKALRVFLETLSEHYDKERVKHIVIADDNAPEAEEVFNELKDKFDGKLSYIGGNRGGIARNKNRCIKYYLEQTKDNFLIMYDDDIQFTGPGIEKRFLDAQYGHICGYLGDPDITNQWNIKMPFFTDFPPHGETQYLWFCLGSQGCCMFFIRKVIDPAEGGVGYFDPDQKGYYGFEHAVYSNRIHRKFGHFPDWYANLKGCEKYFITQEVPNDYEPDYILDKAGNKIIDEKGRPKLINEEWWLKRRKDIIDGIGLVKKDPGLND